MKSIGEVVKIAGISKRTLHYYDEIGLLQPSIRSDGNYRKYNHSDLEKLQKILFFREVGFDLQTIKEMLENKNLDQVEVLKEQKKLLILKKKRLDGLINLVEKSIKGDKKMSFNEFNKDEIENYKKEAKEKWGHTMEYKQSTKKTNTYSDSDWALINKEADAIFSLFYQYKELDVNDQKVIDLVIKWQNHITKYYYTCTNEILSGLADMYIGDERFINNIDKHGKGTAKMMHDAIKAYCQ